MPERNSDYPDGTQASAEKGGTGLSKSAASIPGFPESDSNGKADCITQPSVPGPGALL